MSGISFIHPKLFFYLISCRYLCGSLPLLIKLGRVRKYSNFERNSLLRFVSSQKITWMDSLLSAFISALLLYPRFRLKSELHLRITCKIVYCKRIQIVYCKKIQFQKLYMTLQCLSGIRGISTGILTKTLTKA